MVLSFKLLIHYRQQIKAEQIPNSNTGLHIPTCEMFVYFSRRSQSYCLFANRDARGLSWNLYEGVYRDQQNVSGKIQRLACASRVSDYLEKVKADLYQTFRGHSP